MPTFNYKARDKFGKPISGLMEAESESAIAAKLKQMGYVPVSIKEAKQEIEFNKVFDRFKGVKFADLNMFTRQFAALQKAGLPILLSLDALRDQAVNRVLKDAIGQIARDIEAGAKLSAAFERHPKVFNTIYVNMIKVGETSGNLDEALERLATLGEHEEEVRMRIKAATRYPIMVVIAIAVAFLVLTALVVPRFAQLYGQFSVALPLPTRILIWLNYAITKFWWLTGIVLCGVIFALIKFINTKEGRFWWDGIKLKLPIFGPLMFKLAMTRFARITATLMRSGAPMLEVLELVSGGVGNCVIAKTIDNIRSSVNEGKGMTEPMKDRGMFAPVVVQMVSVGEDTGKIDELLLHVSGYYDSQIDYTINNLTTLIEPILVFILGLAVLFMALGIFLPMWNLMRLFTR